VSLPFFFLFPPPDKKREGSRVLPLSHTLSPSALFLLFYFSGGVIFPLPREKVNVSLFAAP